MIDDDSLLLTPACKDDIAEIAQMSRRLVETGLGWTWTPARVARAANCPDTMVLTAKAQQRLLGFAIMKFLENEAHLNLIAVYPACQRQGLGRLLIRWLEQSALVAGTFLVQLEVRHSRPEVQRFYHSLGYEVAGVIPGYYRGTETALRMQRDLRGR